MKKVISITLGSVVYSMEEDAYKKLNTYLEDIRNNLAGSDDKDEIIDDIESSISEKFFSKDRDEKTAVTIEDVDEVMTELGSVDDITSDEPEEEKKKTNKTTDKDTAHRRMYRNPDDKILGGVASGIAAYLGMDVLLMRVIFIVLALLPGPAIIIYIILWILIPEAETGSQKLEMKGEPVNLNTLRDNIEDGIEKLKKKDKSTLRKIASVPVEIVRIVSKFVIKIFAMIIPFIRIIVGLSLIVAGGIAVAAVVLGALALLFGTGLDAFGLVGQANLSQIFSSRLEWFIFVISVAMVAVIPLFLLLISGAGLVGKKNPYTIGGTIGMFFVWIAAIIITAFIGMQYAPRIVDEISNRREATEDLSLAEERSYLALDPFDKVEFSDGNIKVMIKNGEKHEVYLRSNQDIDKNISVISKNNRLKIKQVRNFDICIFWSCFSRQPIQVVVVTPDLHEFSSSGEVEGVIEKFDTDELKIDSSGSLRLVADIYTNFLEIDSSGSSDIVLLGTAGDLEFNLSGSSKIHGYGLVTQSAKVQSSGSSKVKLNVDANLEVDISGYGDVEYLGQPLVDENISGAGKVSQVSQSSAVSDTSLDYIYELFTDFDYLSGSADMVGVEVEIEEATTSTADLIGQSCENSTDCRLPMEYAVQSNCPYRAACMDGTCMVVCPLWEHSPDPEESVSYPTLCTESSDCDCSGWDQESRYSCECVDGGCASVVSSEDTF
ncbi:MAG: DUF2807 domain-containing protein [Candidatus Magasanikbacteria bacterium]